MSEQTTITIGLVLAFIGGLWIIYSIVDRIKSTSESKGTEKGIINTKLDTIITNLGQLNDKISKLEFSNNDNSNAIKGLTERVIKLEKLAHKPTTRKEKESVDE
jgi:hypothetical protein